MSDNPFRDRLAELAAPAYRLDGPKFTERVLVPTSAGRDPFTGPAERMSTPGQHKYIADLFNVRDLSAEQRPHYVARLRELSHQLDADSRDRVGTDIEGMTFAQASALIDTLKALPYRKVATAAQADVPAGRYAYIAEDGRTVFVKVDRPTEGQWAGRTFVKLQLSDSYERMPRVIQQAVLRRITDQGIKECAVRYGHELGVCGVCGRSLTNEASREAGIGPKCAAGFGW